MYVLHSDFGTSAVYLTGVCTYLNLCSRERLNSFASVMEKYIKLCRTVAESYNLILLYISTKLILVYSICLGLDIGETVTIDRS